MTTNEEPNERAMVMLAWARKLNLWMLRGTRALHPDRSDEEVLRSFRLPLAAANGSLTKEAEIFAGLAQSFAAAGFTEPMPIVPMRVREDCRDLYLAWLWEGYRKLNPTLPEHELVVAMSEAIDRDGWPATKARLGREFQRIGYPPKPSLRRRAQ